MRRTTWRGFVVAIFLCLMMLAGGKAHAGIVHPEEGEYYLVPKCAQGCALSVQDGSAARGANVVIHRNTGKDYQTWRLTRIGNGDFYKLEAANTGQALNVHNGISQNGTEVTVWPYSGTMHQYRFLDVGGGYYAIQANIGGAFVLDVAGGAAHDGTNVHIWSWNGTDAQMWKLVKKNKAPVKGNGDVNGDGKVTQDDADMLLQYVQRKRSSLPRKENADVNGDGDIDIMDVSAVKQMAPPLTTQTPSAPSTSNSASNVSRVSTLKQNIKTLSNGWYKITTGNGLRRVLDVGGAQTTPGSNIQLWDDVNANQQKFYLNNLGDGYFTLKAGHCDLYLAAANGNGRNGTNVQLADKANTVRQKWRLIDAGGGLYYIESKIRTNLSFDCADRGNANGTNVQLWDRGDVLWNKWKFTSVSAPPAFQEWTGYATQQSTVYLNSALTQRNWSKEYVEVGDQVTVKAEEGNAYKVEYPTRNGKKVRWVSKSVISRMPLASAKTGGGVTTHSSYNVNVSPKSKENQPHYTNDVKSRGRDAYNTVIDQFNVTTNKRYKRTDNATYCNIFAWDVMSAMNVSLPHWIKNNAPATSTTQGANEINVNSTCTWMNNYAHQYGWYKVSAAEAQNRANNGYPTIAIWKNPTGKSGHIAVVRPEGNRYSYSESNGPVVAQAGASNYHYANVRKGFGSSKMGDIVYWTHN